MPVSGDTLLRMIRAVTLTPFPAPRVIGIDDWAWRRGRRYGTIICDLERHRPIDLLPDRQADTVAAWLSDHPGIEIVARDRAGAYADGIRSGAPEAIQVADRWHLLRNLGDALAGVLDRHHATLREAAKVARAGTGMEAGSTAPVPAQAVHPPTRSQQRSLDKRAARQARFDEVVGLHTRGCSIRRIALLLGLERKTVRGWLRSGQLPSWRKPPRGSLLDPYRDHLHRRWTEGCRNATQLWREIRDLGFAGRSGMVRDWATRLRRNGPTPSLPRIPKWKTPSGRRAAWLVIAEPDKRDETECAFVEALVGGSAMINQVVALTRDFRRMLRDRQVDQLDHWLAAAKMTPLRSFAEGLCRDPAAVRAALSSPWSTGPVEGQISRLKTIKRQMNGRAGFDLLRQRVLLAA